MLRAMTHDLDELAAQLDACFAVLAMHQADKTIAPDVARTIAELHGLDPSGDAFRYPQVRKPTWGGDRRERYGSGAPVALAPSRQDGLHVTARLPTRPGCIVE